MMKSLPRFFTTFGLPRVVQTDQGTRFLSKTLTQTLKSLGVSHSVSSAHHPESQGALERWHQTLKAMLQRCCLETGRDWDDGLPFMLFAIRDARQESLKLLQERFIGGTSPKTDFLSFVSKCRTRVHSATCELPRAA